jgi:hypothetical protein
MKNFNQYLESIQKKRKIKIQNEELNFSGFGRLIIAIFKHRKEIPTLVTIMIVITKYYYSSIIDYLSSNVDSFKEYKNRMKIKKLSKILFKKIEDIKKDSENEDYLKNLYSNWELQFKKLEQLDKESANKIKDILKTKEDPIIKELLNKIDS